MARYRCDSCNEDRDAPVCIKCGADTRDLSLEEAAAGLAVTRVVPPPSPRNAGVPPADPAPSRRRTPGGEDAASSAGEDAGAPVSEIHGLDEFHALLDRGVKAVVMAGGPQTGKSEIAAGFVRARNVYRGDAQFLTLRAPLRTDYALGGTTPDHVWYQVIDDKTTFLDPSGEFFRRLSLEERQKFGLPDVTENDFQFVQRAARQLAGVICVVDLTKAVDMRSSAPWRRQEDDLNFILAAMRWLRWDKLALPPHLGLSVNIAQRVKALPMLDVPVLVLFSKGDQLTRITNESPLQFAKRRLPVLHGSVMTHARRFRYDFCHTMIRSGGQDRAVDHPCGVLLPIEWILRRPFRWLPMQLPSRLLGGGK